MSPGPRVETVEGAAERLEQTKLGEAGIRLRRELLELAENALPGWAGDQFGVAQDELLGFQVDHESQLVLEPDGPQQAERVVPEHALAHRTDDAPVEVAVAAEGVELVPAGEWARDHVDGEIAVGEVASSMTISSGVKSTVSTRQPVRDSPGSVRA